MSVKPANFFRTAIVSAFFLTLFLPQPYAPACTGIMLRNTDGSIVHGRTLEFGIVIDFKLAIVPRGYEFVAKAPGGPGMKYKSKYGAVGTITFGDVAILDGMNEKGLAVGVFSFSDFR